MKTRTIIFEDDDGLRKLLQFMLEAEGHEVLAFSDPSACPLFNDPVCRCPQNHPCADILITDMKMPNMSGLEFMRMQRDRGCKAIQKNKLILSANMCQRDIVEAQSLGCSVMSKPFRPAHLVEWARQCVERIAPDRTLARLVAY